MVLFTEYVRVLPTQVDPGDPCRLGKFNQGDKGEGSIFPVDPPGLTFASGPYFKDPHMLFMHLDRAIKTVEAGERKEPLHIQDVFLGQFLSRFVKNNPFAAQHAIESSTLKILVFFKI